MAYGKTIAAISTPSGKGGVAIIRISGDEAIEVASRVFFPKNKKPVSELTARMQVWGDIAYGGEYIDDGMLTVFKSPASYTGEDVVEISCHGGILVTRTVLEAILSAGACLAEPGEFTRRAFINGKLTLTEAEAVGDLLEAKSREQIRLTSAASRTRLSGAIAEIRGTLTELLSSTFARIDYPDEDLGDFTDEESLDRLYKVKNSLLRLISTYPTGKAITEGVNTVLCGKTNVGKSTVYNSILGEDAAIVTDIEGTTRDVLCRSVPLGRVMLNLSDTAGIRDGERADAVEKIGIDRTRAAISGAELIISVFDGARVADFEDADLLALLSTVECPKIALINKCELDSKFDLSLLKSGFDYVISASAKTNEGEMLSKLSDAVNALFTDEKISVGNEAVVSSARHNASLTRALTFVDAAIAAYSSGVYADAAASEVERALGAIAEIDGRAVSEEVVSDIFSKFCVGK